MEQLYFLRGHDRIRKRPQVVFPEGPHKAVENLLLVFAKEASLGYCNTLVVRQDGLYFYVKADGRGIYLGQDTIGSTRWKEIFCEFYARHKFYQEQKNEPLDIDDSHRALFGEEPFAQEEFYYLDLYGMNCVSTRMTITVNRNGIRSQLKFERGFDVGGIINSQTNEPDGNTFEFEIDEEVFPGAVIPEDHILEALKGYALLIPGFRCRYQNVNGETVSFCYSEGHPKQ